MLLTTFSNNFNFMFGEALFICFHFILFETNLVFQLPFFKFDLVLVKTGLMSYQVRVRPCLVKKSRVVPSAGPTLCE